MTAWTAAALALLAALAVLAVSASRAASHAKALVQVQLAGTVAALLLLVTAHSLGRSIYFELPLVAAAASLVGTVAVVRIIGRRL